MIIETVKKVNDQLDKTVLIGYSVTNSQNDEVVFVPNIPSNSDFQAIQEWIAEGNTVKDADDTLTWDDIRATRDELLSDTDWTMTTGATVDQAQWAAYRQVIRDIPQTYKDKTPDDVVWPTQPSTKGPNS